MRNTKSTAVVLWCAIAIVGLGLSGCQGEVGWWNWFDPPRSIKRPAQPTISPIFPQIGPTDQTMELIPNATFPTIEDLQYTEEDYVIGPTDIVRISVLDLLQDGIETVVERPVSYSGHIDLLLAGSIKATGLTKDQLVERIKETYRQEDILKDPSVSVTVTVPRQNVFSLLGAISRPGPYFIPRKDFTLLEAMSMGGDVSQINLSWIYIIRPKNKARQAAAAKPEETELPPLPELPEPATRPGEEALPGPTTRPLVEELPGSKAPPKKEDLDELMRAITGPGPARPARDEGPSATAPAVEPLAPETATAPADVKAPAVVYEWVYSQGRWIHVPRPTAPGAPGVAPPEMDGEKDPFGWSQYDMSSMSRIIAIDLRELKAGNQRMNIIIRNKDIIHVPTLEVGEFYVMGDVMRPGVYSLTGRRVTARMAVAAAGNVGPLGWPNNSTLTRRIGRNQEQTTQLKLQDIIHGKEPDVFLKPNDVIAVGSYWAAPFLAVWRNAFRLTYGFGFIYDRNYSEYEFEIPLLAPKSDLRKRW